LVSVNGTAAVPTSSLSLSTSEANIAQTYVNAGGTVSVIKPEDDVIVTMGFYAVQ
jgi:hypothetical protein